MSLEAILSALHKNPSDHLGWLAIADCLEELGEAERADLARCSALARQERDEQRGRVLGERVRELLAAGVLPCVPTLTNSMGMTFVLIPPGVFLMGSPQDEEDRSAD